MGPNIGRDGVGHRDAATLVGVALLYWSLCAVGAREANILVLYICGLISSPLVGDGASLASHWRRPEIPQGFGMCSYGGGAVPGVPRGVPEPQAVSVAALLARLGDPFLRMTSVLR